MSISNQQWESYVPERIWRIRKVNSAIGGWVVEYGFWGMSQKLIRDGCGPRKFHVELQSHFHTEKAALQYFGTKI